MLYIYIYITPAVPHKRYVDFFCVFFVNCVLQACVFEPLSRDLMQHIFMQMNPAPTKNHQADNCGR